MNEIFVLMYVWKCCLLFFFNLSYLRERGQKHVQAPLCQTEFSNGKCKFWDFFWHYITVPLVHWYLFSFFCIIWSKSQLWIKIFYEFWLDFLTGNKLTICQSLPPTILKLVLYVKLIDEDLSKTSFLIWAT